MERFVKETVRWLVLLLFLAPFALGQTAVAEADYVLTLDPAGLQPFVPVGTDTGALDCGSDHFEHDSVGRWFKFVEKQDGASCAEARYVLPKPIGAKSLEVSFTTNRIIEAPVTLQGAEPSFDQNLILYSSSQEPLQTRNIFRTSAGEQPLTEFLHEFNIGDPQTVYILAWQFQEPAGTTGWIPTPVTAVDYSAFVEDPVARFKGVPLETAERAGTSRVTGETEFVETLVRIEVTESMLRNAGDGHIDLRISLPSSFQAQDVRIPSGEVLIDPLVVSNSQGITEIVLPGAHVSEAGTYQFSVIRKTPLQSSALMVPIAVLAIGFPLLASGFAIRETRRFQKNATTASQSTAELLSRGNTLAIGSILILLIWLVFFQRIKLMTSLPMQLEGTLYYVLLLAFGIGGFAIWFLTRFQLREIEMDMERLEDLNQVKSQMIGTMSHELKTPLTPMKMELDMLESGFMGDLSEEQKESVSSIQSSLERLSHLVSDILDVSKSDTGKLKIIIADMDLAGCVQSVMKTSRFHAQDQGVQLTYEGPASLSVDADEVRMAQVMTNLIDNAIKFTPRDGTVTISLIDEGSNVFLSVKDSGQGMPPAELRNLFTPFGQIHADRETNRTGTGLGLYICKGIVEGHGGTIQAKSDGIGHGSSFEIRIPKSKNQSDS